MMHTLHSALLGGLLLAAVPLRLHAQPLQDGLVAYPNVYKVQLENAYVRLIRVRLPGFAQLGEHTHPAGIMLHVYFNDADPVQFNHDGPPNDVTRPAVVARSYRIGRTRPETHAVVNTGPGLSDYMRVELKTEGDEGFLRRIPTPPLVDSTSARVEVDNAQYRASRVTIASRQSIELVAPGSQPFLLLALTPGIDLDEGGAPTRTLQTGDERFVGVSQRVLVRNAGTSPVQLLKVDLLTAPAK
ncbi:MAG TPA: hypothetical protein VE869_15760 [Gemmatimonas sp.]|nr:hypothetical protein [Gemmatimonas sp.]